MRPRVRHRWFALAKVLKRDCLAPIVFTGVMLALDSAHSQFVLTPGPGLPPVFSGSVAWGDSDNDGRLDFLLSGTDGLTGAPTWRPIGVVPTIFLRVKQGP
jgi:hypothetical protein